MRGPDGSAAPFPATINAIHQAGADRIFVVGGVQAFAMMAFGLEGLEPADMLCGAGNKYVAEAKRQLFGRCGIDLLAGPTEILIIADDTADPSLVACDLLGQAEHDPASSVCLICLSRKFGEAVLEEVAAQLPKLPSREVAGASWSDNGSVVVAQDREEAVRLSDDWAPEHLEVHAKELEFYLDQLSSYGSLFLGEETTVAYGDKSIGTNHILPTGRAARYTGGLWVGKFLKTCTYQRMTPEASARIGRVTERQCHVENLPGHAETAARRVSRYQESGG
jgi:sulfopropanediol 3-dehydrogenase